MNAERHAHTHRGMGRLAEHVSDWAAIGWLIRHVMSAARFALRFRRASYRRHPFSSSHRTPTRRKTCQEQASYQYLAARDCTKRNPRIKSCPMRKGVLHYALGLFFACSYAVGAAQPNILFCIADDWSWPHASIYGDKVVRTPTF